MDYTKTEIRQQNGPRNFAEHIISIKIIRHKPANSLLLMYFIMSTATNKYLRERSQTILVWSLASPPPPTINYLLFGSM